jgi:hypothetical protein
MSDILPPDSVEVLPKGDIPRRGLYPCGAHSCKSLPFFQPSGTASKDSPTTSRFPNPRSTVSLRRPSPRFPPGPGIVDLKVLYYIGEVNHIAPSLDLPPLTSF